MYKNIIVTILFIFLKLWYGHGEAAKKITALFSFFKADEKLLAYSKKIKLAILIENYMINRIQFEDIIHIFIKKSRLNKLNRLLFYTIKVLFFHSFML